MTDADSDKDIEDDYGSPSTVTVHRRSWGILNLVYRLLGRHSVTSQWPRQTNPRLEFNFDSLTLSGVGLGRPLRELSLLGLGPADEEYGEGCRFLHYRHLGLQISASDDYGIYGFFFNSWDFDTLPFTFLVGGRTVPLSNTTERDEVVEYFGTPSDSTDERDFVSVSYERASGEFTIVFRDEGNIMFLDVTTI